MACVMSLKATSRVRATGRKRLKMVNAVEPEDMGSLRGNRRHQTQGKFEKKRDVQESIIIIQNH